MIKKYIPNKCYKTIFDIDFDDLKENGIHGLLFDIDNTILPYGILDPEEKHINFINYNTYANKSQVYNKLHYKGKL